MFGEVTRVQCPYCFEWVEIQIEPDLSGEMVFDCEVCCRPWAVHITWDGGQPRVVVRRAQ